MSEKIYGKDNPVLREQCEEDWEAQSKKLAELVQHPAQNTGLICVTCDKPFSVPSPTCSASGHSPQPSDPEKWEVVMCNVFEGKRKVVAANHITEEDATRIVEAVNFCRGAFTETLHLVNLANHPTLVQLCEENQALRKDGAAKDAELTALYMFTEANERHAENQIRQYEAELSALKAEFDNQKSLANALEKSDREKFHRDEEEIAALKAENETITTLKAENERLANRVRELEGSVQYAADIFDSYENMHRAKGPEAEHKALMNKRHADLLKADLQKGDAKG